MANGEPKLTDAMRAYVVQELASWVPPSVVAEAIRKDFGIKITPQSIEAYDPTKRAGAKLAQRWKVLFETTRKAVQEDTSRIGVSHKAVRLRALERMAQKAEAAGNMVLAASLLEQAAKEIGNAFTNTRVLSGGLAVSVPKTLSDFYGENGGTDGA